MSSVQHNVRNGKKQTVDLYKSDRISGKGLKYDKVDKQPWYAMPLTVLAPLADAFAAGERKYETFNCMNPFDDSDRRFWDATMRHLEACQRNPLSRDTETECYHAAQAAFNILLRLHNAIHFQPDRLTNPTITEGTINDRNK